MSKNSIAFGAPGFELLRTSAASTEPFCQAAMKGER